MGEGKHTNDSGDIILGVPAIYEKEGHLINAYEIGRGWPHYKDFDFGDENFEFMGEVMPIFTLEAENTDFPPPLEAASTEGVSEAGVSEAGVSKAGVSEAGVSKADVSEADEGATIVSDGEKEIAVTGKIPNTVQVDTLSLDVLDGKLNSIIDFENWKDKEIPVRSIDEANAFPDFIPADFVTCSLDEIHLRLNGSGTKDIDICRLNGSGARDIDICSFDIIDDSLFSQDGVDKVNYSDAVITGFNLDIGAGSADFDIDMGLFEPDVEKVEKLSVSLISQISKRLQIFVRRMVSEGGFKIQGGLASDKETLSGIVDNIMDKLQIEIDEAEDISLEVQRTDWSRYRLLRAVVELLVVMEIGCQVDAII